jgi:hypothetical protein
MRVSIDETVWKVSLQTQPMVWRGEGEPPPQYRSSGIWFNSAKGESRFAVLGTDEMPTEGQLASMPLDQLIPLLRRAT